MWSHIYDYYEIRSSEKYDAVADTKMMCAALDAAPELERCGLMIYRNAPGHPWIDLVLAKGQNGNFNCFSDTWHDEFNVIPVVCSKLEDGNIPNTQRAFLIKVAQTLKWELINEENNVGQRDVVIWSPI